MKTKVPSIKQINKEIHKLHDEYTEVWDTILHKPTPSLIERAKTINEKILKLIKMKEYKYCSNKMEIWMWGYFWFYGANCLHGIFNTTSITLFVIQFTGFSFALIAFFMIGRQMFKNENKRKDLFIEML